MPRLLVGKPLSDFNRLHLHVTLADPCANMPISFFLVPGLTFEMKRISIRPDFIVQSTATLNS